MLTRRRPLSSDTDQVRLLADVPLGRRATILGTVPETASVVAGRLYDLGFRPKSQVDVVRRAPLGDPTIYRINDTELCLRRREARLVEIAPAVSR